MECLNHPDGLLNLQAMVDQMTTKAFLEDKSIPIVLGRVSTVSEATLY
jgi:hypothetical protein